MANYNNEKYVSEAIKSVVFQTYKNWELVIVDDCSTDNSVNVIKKELKDKRIRFFENDKNIGFTGTLRKLVDLAKKETVCILDSDDFIEKNTLNIVNDAVRHNPGCGYFYTQCYYCDKNLKPVHLGFSKRIVEGKTNLHNSSVVAMRIFKKKDYFKTYGYDESIKYAEDIDLTFKLEEKTNLFFIDKPLYYYRVLPKSQTHSFLNTQINRSSTALAKLNAYKRRLGTDIPNLSENEVSEVLFFGLITSLLSFRFKLFLKFFRELFLINPLFFLKISFYVLLLNKVSKIIKLKKEKPLLKI